MTLTLERPLTTEFDRPGSPAPTPAPVAPAMTAPTPPAPKRRRRRRWTALAVLLVAGLLVALLVSADSAEPAQDVTTVELEPVDKPDPKPSAPTNASPGDAEVPTLWPFGTGDDAAPACGRVPWLVLCPEKTAP